MLWFDDYGFKVKGINYDPTFDLSNLILYPMLI